jgi:hypothetical protein
MIEHMFDSAEILRSDRRRRPARAGLRPPATPVVLRIRRSTAVMAAAATAVVAVLALRSSVVATEARSAAADRAYAAASAVSADQGDPTPTAALGRAMCAWMDRGAGAAYAVRYPAMMGLHQSCRMGEEARWRALALAAALFCPAHAEAVRAAYVRRVRVAGQSRTYSFHSLYRSTSPRVAAEKTSMISRVTGPGRPEPTLRSSTSAIGTTSAAVPVKNASSAR